MHAALYPWVGWKQWSIYFFRLHRCNNCNLQIINMQQAEEPGGSDGGPYSYKREKWILINWLRVFLRQYTAHPVTAWISPVLCVRFNCLIKISSMRRSVPGNICMNMICVLFGLEPHAATFRSSHKQPKKLVSGIICESVFCCTTNYFSQKKKKKKG